MSSTIFGMLNPQNQPPKQLNNMFGNFGNFMKQYSAFRNRMQGIKDPKAEVERMLANGEITQEQFNQAAQMASEAYSMMGGRQGANNGQFRHSR